MSWPLAIASWICDRFPDSHASRKALPYFLSADVDVMVGMQELGPMQHKLSSRAARQDMAI